MRPQSLSTLFVLAIASCLLDACAPFSDSSSSGTLLITGSSTVAPLVEEIANRYEIEHPGVQINVEAGGSGKGLADARSGHANIGMVSRALTNTDQDLYAFPIARDGISILLHRDNPVTQLTHEQILGIYQDTINNWQEVGGDDRPIVVINKAEGHATLELFTRFLEMENSSIKADQVIKGNEEAIAAVEITPNAIGYVSIGTAEQTIIHGAPIKLLPIDNVLATIANVANDTFPLTRPLNLVTNATPTGLVDDFITYAQSDTVADLVKEQAFIPLPDDQK